MYKTLGKSFGHLLIPVVTLAVLAACSHEKRGVQAIDSTASGIAPAPVIAPNDSIKTFAAYTASIETALKSLPNSVKTGVGPERLISATRELAALRSEAARSYARSLIQLLKRYDLDAGPVPAAGAPVISYTELATVDALSQAMMRGPESEHQGPAPAGPNTIPYSLYLEMLVVISREAPSDQAAFAATWNTTNSLPAEISTDDRLSVDQEKALYTAAWANFRAHFVDASRPVNLSAGAVASASDAFLYVLYYAGNAVASAPEIPLTGHELRDLIGGYERLNRKIRRLDPSISAEPEGSGRSLEELEKFARNIDENIAIARAARPDLVRFFRAVAANDDATVKELSSSAAKKTAAQWRDYFGFDRPNPVRSLEVVGVGVTESAGIISIGIKKTDSVGLVGNDHHFVTVRKRGKRWVVVKE